MYGKNGTDFGSASNGDGDRNMVLGREILCHYFRFCHNNCSQCKESYSMHPGWSQGTCYAGATIRMYIKRLARCVETQYGWPKCIKTLNRALSVSKLKNFTGNEKPSFIT